jgi:drug/metabolite transporter (DMT)-like permease
VPSANRRGILALAVGMAVFSVNDVLVKVVTLRYPVGEVIFIRGVITVSLMAAAVIALGHARQLRLALTGTVAVRSICDALAAILFVIALVHMKLAELSAVILAAPLFLTALSVLFYREIVGWRAWLAVLVGFLGTLFVVKPTPAAFDGWALLGLAAALSAASRDLVTRRLEPGIPTTVIALMGLIATTLLALVMGLFEDWRAMPADDVLTLAIAALFIGAAIYLIVVAFRGVDISVVAPFRYTYLLWATIAGYVAFAEVPDRWSLIGGALIVASGLYALQREAARPRKRSG